MTSRPGSPKDPEPEDDPGAEEAVLDAAIIGVEPNNSQKFTKYIENTFVNEHSKFYFLDAGIEGSQKWNDKWTKKNAKINEFLGIKNLKELVLDPKNYFYHQNLINLSRIN